MYERPDITRTMDEADREEDMNEDREMADVMRRFLFQRQIRQLQSAIGQRVRVVSKGYFSRSPDLELTESGLTLDVSGFSIDGATSTNEGNLSSVDKLLSIRIDKDDGSGIHGLPFVGASSIREVTRTSDGRLLYFNPRIDDEFHIRFIH